MELISGKITELEDHTEELDHSVEVNDYFFKKKYELNVKVGHYEKPNLLIIAIKEDESYIRKHR